MWLVVCHSTDPAALWAYEGLSQRALAPLVLVTSETLGCSRRWEHRLGRGGCIVDITLADGTRIESRQVRGTLNRIQWIPPEMLAVGVPEDQLYASQELYAFFMGWLYSLPSPLLNEPTPQGLSGRWRYPSEWQSLAGQAGLRTRPFRISARSHDAVNAAFVDTSVVHPGRRTVIVLAGEVVGDDVPPEVSAGCRHLAELAETLLLGVDFDVATDGAWVFAGAGVSPDLRWGGAAFLDKLASLFHRPGSALERS